MHTVRDMNSTAKKRGMVQCTIPRVVGRGVVG